MYLSSSDIFRQFIVELLEVGELGMPVDLARLPAEIGMMLAVRGAAHAGEFVGLHEFLEAYGHGHVPCGSSPRAYVISAQLAATVAWSRSRLMNTSLERRSSSGQRASRVGGGNGRGTPGITRGWFSPATSSTPFTRSRRSPHEARTAISQRLKRSQSSGSSKVRQNEPIWASWRERSGCSC